jgi:hypothetical protein
MVDMPVDPLQRERLIAALEAERMTLRFWQRRRRREIEQQLDELYANRMLARIASYTRPPFSNEYTTTLGLRAR